LRASDVSVRILEGETIAETLGVVGAPAGSGVLAVLDAEGDAAIRFDEGLLSKHVLFLGSIGSGKTNGMMQLVDGLRSHAGPDDVFIIFDTKGDFLSAFHTEGDVVISNERALRDTVAVWNLFADLLAGEPDDRQDEGFEIASTIFAEELDRAGENFFFAAAARDVFATVVEAICREGGERTNADLRRAMESSQDEIVALMSKHDDLVGARHYLTGQGNTPRAVLAFAQQPVRAAFSGIFRQPGDFSVRQFVREKGGRALFIEYDIAVGSLLSPVYRVLLDLAIKEALGRERSAGNVYFVMDEFALLPHLQHVSDGINFGRALGLKFIVGSQNVGQVHYAYGRDLSSSILSGFGTVFAFRLMDEESRRFVSERFGENRKLFLAERTVRAQGLHEEVITGKVLEDWDLSSLRVGQTIASLPEGPPFRFDFRLRAAEET
jgi:type IV secretory pathway TraG/TraD family ATPase VirD4